MLADTDLGEIRCKVVLVGNAGKSRFALGLETPTSQNVTENSTILYHPPIMIDLGKTIVTMYPTEVSEGHLSKELHIGFKRAVMGASAYGLICEHNSLDDVSDSSFYNQYQSLWELWHPQVLSWFSEYENGLGASRQSIIEPFIFLVEIGPRKVITLDKSQRLFKENRKLIAIDIMSRFESAEFLHFYVHTNEDRTAAWTRIAAQIQTQRLTSHKVV